MNYAKILISVLTAALLFLSGCSRQQPVPTVPDASVAVIETTAPAVPDVTGSWVMDCDKTEAGLKEYTSLLGMFGTGLQQGSGMDLGDDGSFRFYIGIGWGGEGTYVLNGIQLDAQITPYVEGDTELSLTVLTEDGGTWLAMELGGETIYWKRA